MASNQHLGIWCDATGASPITGTRYTKQLRDDTYDVCEEAYGKMSAEEQAEFTAIKVPDIKLLAKHMLSRDAGCVDAPKTAAAPAPAPAATPEPMAMDWQTALGGCGLSPEQIDAVEAAMARKQHLGIWCDATGASPITGTRYTKQMQGDTYDVCEDVFKKLSAEEQAEFTAIKVPDIKLVVKNVVEAAAIDAAVAEESPPVGHQLVEGSVTTNALQSVLAALHTKQRCIAALRNDCGLSPEQVAAIVNAIEGRQHLGIWCDATNHTPITGTRYTKQLRDDTYDVCEEAYGKMSAEEQAESA